MHVSLFHRWPLASARQVFSPGVSAYFLKSSFYFLLKIFLSAVQCGVPEQERGISEQGVLFPGERAGVGLRQTPTRGWGGGGAAARGGQGPRRSLLCTWKRILN